MQSVSSLTAATPLRSLLWHILSVLFWRVNTSRRSATCPQFLISIPKKKLRHAVDRVQMRRRVREAYRLNRHLIPSDLPLDIAFIYIPTTLTPYADIEKSVIRILTRITHTLQAQ